LIQAWRLCQAAHTATAFNGDGARIYGGRWNNKGQPVIYTASSLSLAALEVLAHADTDLMPNDFFSFVVSIPDDKIGLCRKFYRRPNSPVSGQNYPANAMNCL
jgi:RES domain-containing protein